MSYTVKKLAAMTGLTVRTLHYYDEIGLLKPSSVGENGYRYYEQPDLLKLQQVLFFRELEFPLEIISAIVNDPTVSSQKILTDQHKLLKVKQKRLEKLVNTLEKTLKNLKGGDCMSDDSLFTAFSDDQLQKYQEEAKERWGNTQAYQQSMARTKSWTKAQWDEVKAEGSQITLAMANLMDKSPDHPEVQATVKKFFYHIGRFYDLTPNFLKNLGQMYVDDPRFTATYEKIKPGLAVFMRDALVVFGDKYGDNQPD